MNRECHGGRFRRRTTRLCEPLDQVLLLHRRWQWLLLTWIATDLFHVTHVLLDQSTMVLDLCALACLCSSSMLLVQSLMSGVNPSRRIV